MINGNKSSNQVYQKTILDEQLFCFCNFSGVFYLHGKSTPRKTRQKLFREPKANRLKKCQLKIRYLLWCHL